MNVKEKILFYFLVLIFLSSSVFWGISYYFSKTQAVSDYGGEYIEGIIGQPLHINPLLSSSNETDADLVRLIYSGLFKYDNQGKIEPDLAESYELSDDKTAYTVHLRPNVLWQDEEPLTSADVAFTISILSNPTYKSPLKGNWQGITTKVIDERTLEFKIENPYVGFLNNLTFGILPKHLWQSITPENFSLNPLNLKPIGSGPYKYNSIQKDSNDNILSYKLIANPDYFSGRPYISKMTFNFYTNEDTALSALNRKEIMGIGAMAPDKIKDIAVQKSTAVYNLQIPRYFAVFFNQTKSIPVASDEVREALSLATDRQEIIEKILSGFGQEAYSPFMSGMIGYSPDAGQSRFNLEEADRLLDDKGWEKGVDGFRGKDGESLEISLVTTDWDDLVKTAEIIKEQWERVGIRVNVESYPISDIQENYIRPREYEALLFGQVVGADPDPYSFWHSNNKKDPGLNLSLFDDSESDKLIEEGRVEFDAEKRAGNYTDFQKILSRENPAIFLYSPDYIYTLNRKIKGLDSKENLISPDGRFSDANLWYIKTKRVWK